MMQVLSLGFALTIREFSQRYRGTALGLLWPFLYAFLLLSLFTFVFSYVLKVRWSSVNDGRPYEGALMIFAGLVPYLYLAEVLTRSTTCVTAVPNFVKKVRFPLALLPGVIVGCGAAVALINTLILIFAEYLLWGVVPVTVLILPLVFVPLTLAALGLGFFLSALGVFFRDLAQATPLAAQLLMYVAPVCYPMSIIPAGFFLTYIGNNPLTWVVTSFRDLALDGRLISPSQWTQQTLCSGVFAALGYAFFNRTRSSFADLL